MHTAVDALVFSGSHAVHREPEPGELLAFEVESGGAGFPTCAEPFQSGRPCFTS